MNRCRVWLLVLPLLTMCACARTSPVPASHLVVGIGNAPLNLDPGVGLDEASQRIHQLVFDSLTRIDDNLRVVPDLASSVETLDGRQYIVTLPAGVRFHDGRLLTSADVVYTYRRFLDPQFLSGRKGAYTNVVSVEAIDTHRVRFVLDSPSAAFPANLSSMGIVPDGAGAEMTRSPVGTGPYRLVRFVPDDHVLLDRFEDYYRGAPANSGLFVKVVPDETMRGLELRNGSVDIVVNDLSPDLVHSLSTSRRLQVVTGPGTDYAYLGTNLRDPVLADVRVRRAIAHAIDRRAIIDYLRRGLGRESATIVPSMSWAHADDVDGIACDPAAARQLLDEAGYPDPDGDGPAPRLRLSLKTSSTEAYRLQAAVLQQQLAAVGIALDLQSYEFATLFSDVQRGNVQLYTMIFVGGSVADPDILRRVFHSSQVPPAGFNRAHYRDAEVDRLLDAATAAQTDDERQRYYAAVQRVIARDVPLISLWTRTNVAVTNPALEGVVLSPLGDFWFLKDVRRR